MNIYNFIRIVGLTYNMAISVCVLKCNIVRIHIYKYIYTHAHIFPVYLHTDRCTFLYTKIKLHLCQRMCVFYLQIANDT